MRRSFSEFEFGLSSASGGGLERGLFLSTLLSSSSTLLPHYTGIEGIKNDDSTTSVGKKKAVPKIQSTMAAAVLSSCKAS